MRTCCVGVFFFSSRRRHTRWTGDWSSDVCSSDLCRCWRGPSPPRARQRLRGGTGSTPSLAHRPRSEERRVGKECRSRGSSYQYKKKCSTGLGCKLELSGGYSFKRELLLTTRLTMR